jgi:hypothetical protein
MKDTIIKVPFRGFRGKNEISKIQTATLKSACESVMPLRTVFVYFINFVFQQNRIICV